MQTVRVEQLAQLLRDTILESEARERERIIKLLEEQDWLPSIKTHIIELIKGENE